MKKFLLNRYLFLVLSGLALAIYFVPEFFLPPIASFLVRNDYPRKVEAEIILLGAESPDRVLKAFDLYKRGWTKTIIIGSGYSDETVMDSAPEELLWPPASARYVLALQSLGVPREDIVIVPTEDGVDTDGELRAVAEALRKKEIKNVILVSSPTHTKRVSLIWARVAPDIEGATIAPPSPRLETWWRHTPLIRSVGYEYGALVKELFRQIKALVGL